MNKLRKKRFLGVPLAVPLVLLVAVLATGVALAVITLPIPSTVKVVGHDILAWQDIDGSGGAGELTAIPWGDIARGASGNFSAYIENVGNESVDVTATASDIDGTGITLTGGPITVGVGAIVEFPLTLSASAAATLGVEAGGFTITFDSTAT